MSVVDKEKPCESVPAGKRNRRFLSPEKKYQLFLEAQRKDARSPEMYQGNCYHYPPSVEDSFLHVVSASSG